MRIVEQWRTRGVRLRLEGAEPSDREQMTFPPRPVEAREVVVYDFKTLAHESSEAQEDTKAA